jgi:hypothetical protein
MVNNPPISTKIPLTEHRNDHNIYGVGNRGPGLGKAQKSVAKCKTQLFLFFKSNATKDVHM